jgi:hypothetical protein
VTEPSKRDGEPDDTYTPEGYERRRDWLEQKEAAKSSEISLAPGGGLDMVFLEREVKSNYIHGNFLSTIITACCLIESLLFKQVIDCDPSKINETQNMGLNGVISKAKEFGVISDEDIDESDSVDEIRTMRNAVVHYRFGHEEDALTWEYAHPTHLNKFGKKHAEKMLSALFDVEENYTENQRLAYKYKGPLKQGSTTVTIGQDIQCNHCGTDLTDKELELSADWNGTELENRNADCPDCGGNVVSQFPEFLLPDDPDW